MPTAFACAVLFLITSSFGDDPATRSDGALRLGTLIAAQSAPDRPAFIAKVTDTANTTARLIAARPLGEPFANINGCVTLTDDLLSDWQQKKRT